MKSLHVICAKCGDTDIKIVIRLADEYPVESGVTFRCNNCGEHTSAEELQEQLDIDNKRRRA